ncbi:hypothetical protein AURDEDRAFT_113645 [Auricularia subglabra TFB-10046 SS5]|nr:hypothetical protein AURDEDRAFT_113645 [Auricularia subglabra TFB-10046 SS5]
MPKAKKSKAKYYAVAQGKVPGVYETWDAAMEQLRGFTNARHRSFKTLQAAEKYLQENGVTVGAATRSSKRLAGLAAHGFTAKKTPGTRTEPLAPPPPNGAAAGDDEAVSVADAFEAAAPQEHSSRAATPESPEVLDALESLLRLQDLTANALAAFGRGHGKAPSLRVLRKEEIAEILLRVNDGFESEQRILKAVSSKLSPDRAPRAATVPTAEDASLPPEKDPAAPSSDDHSDVSFLSLYEAR